MRRGKRGASNSSTRCTGAPESLALFAGRRSAGSWWGSAGRTTVRSASEAEHLVGHLYDDMHGRDVVYAHQVSAGENGGGDGSRRSAFDQKVGRLFQGRQKRFARGPDQDRQLQRGELR